MALVADVLECPNCGAPVALQERVCGHCHSPVIVRRIQEVGKKSPQELNKYIQLYRNALKMTTGESVETLTALGICLLQKGSYAEALKHLEKAITLLPDDGESHYYLVLAMMQKKRPYMHTLTEIKRMVQYLDTALTYGTNGKYYYLLYLIQVDFYNKKHLRNGRDANELMASASANELDDQDVMECNEYCGM